MARLRYADAITSALREEMLADDRVFIVGEEVGQYLGTLGVTSGFLKEFGPLRVVIRLSQKSSFWVWELDLPWQDSARSAK